MRRGVFAGGLRVSASSMMHERFGFDKDAEEMDEVDVVVEAILGDDVCLSGVQAL